MKVENEIKSVRSQLEEAKKKIMDSNEDLIQIGDKVNLNLIYENEDYENITVILTKDTYDLETGEISLSSPLGNLIHHKEIGFEGFFPVNNKKIGVVILNKLAKTKTLKYEANSKSSQK